MAIGMHLLLLALFIAHSSSQLHNYFIYPPNGGTLPSANPAVSSVQRDRDTPLDGQIQASRASAIASDSLANAQHQSQSLRLIENSSSSQISNAPSLSSQPSSTNTALNPITV